MLPATRGLRKEMLPLFYRGTAGSPVLAPVVHHVLRTLEGAGVHEMVLVVGTDGAMVRRYFETDLGFLHRHRQHPERLRETEALHALLGRLRLHWAVQREPRGFGHAVLRAAPFLGPDRFLLHAADAVLLEPSPGKLPGRMLALLEQEEADAVLLVRRVKDPRRYGVVEGPRREGRHGPYLEVNRMVEKPTHPESPWAATAVYAFTGELLPRLRAKAREHPRELEVTDGINGLLSAGLRVLAVPLEPHDGEWLSVGSPEGYLRALERTHRFASTGTLAG